MQTMRQARKMHIMPEILEVRNFIRRRSGALSSDSKSPTIGSGSSLSVNIEEWLDKAKARNIQEILSATEAGNYIVKAHIVDVDPRKAWYYNACGNVKCNKKVQDNRRVGDMCSSCNTILSAVVPRFKISVSPLDTEENEIKLVLSNNATYLMSRTAVQALSELENGDIDSLPKSFDKLLSKECFFLIEVNETYNIGMDNNIYTVKKVQTDESLLAHFTSLMAVKDVVNNLTFESKTPDEECIGKTPEVEHTEETEGSSSQIPLYNPTVDKGKRKMADVEEEIREAASRQPKALRIG